MKITNRNSSGKIVSEYSTFDTEKTRFCSVCKTIYPNSNFYKDKRTTSGLSRRCKSCWSSKSYDSRRKRPNFKSERYTNFRSHMLRAKYNITQDDYDKMLSLQNGKCAICKCEPNSWHGNNEYGHLFVDHNHMTGKIRGLLCQLCNSGLGQFKDSVANLKEAIKYLEKEEQNGRQV